MVSTLESLLRGSRLPFLLGLVIQGCAASGEKTAVGQRQDAGVSRGESDDSTGVEDASAGEPVVADASSLSTGTEPDVEEPLPNSSSTSDIVTDSVPSASNSSAATGANSVQADSGVAGDTSDHVPSSDTSADETPSGPPPLLSYLPCDVERIIAERCRLCHSRLTDGQQPLLDTWAQVSSKAELVLDAVSRDIMPLLPPPLTLQQKETLTDWVEQGSQSVRQKAAPNCSG